MKIIVCTGDSHTVGQGASGLTLVTEGYNHLGTGMSAELDGEGGSYVNLIRDFVLAQTGTTRNIVRVGYGEASQPLHCPERGMYPITGGCLKMDIDADIALILFAESRAPAAAEIRLDGVKTRDIPLCTDTPRYGGYSFRLVPVDCPGARELEIIPTDGEVRVKSVDFYKGGYSVINGGIGTCPAERFLDRYYGCCVAPFAPEIIIAEAHTINDWLILDSPAVYEERLRRLLRRFRETGARVIMTTVSPVLGSQIAPGGKYLYGEYVEASRAAALKEAVLTADAHLAMCRRLDGLSEDEKRGLMYADDWHVNDLGHKIYADVILCKLKEILS